MVKLQLFIVAMRNDRVNHYTNMSIQNPAIANLQTPIKSVLESFAASPFNLAPERKDELKAIADAHAFELVLDLSDQGFVVNVHLGGAVTKPTVTFGLHTLERIWAYSYSYFTLLEIARDSDPGTEVDLLTHPTGAKARQLLAWAVNNETSAVFEQWPTDAPTPDDVDDVNVPVANELFLAMCGWIFLHELGHLELHSNFSGPHKDATIESQLSIQREFEADNWASSWVLDKWEEHAGGVEGVFVKRSLGIAFALAALTGVEFYSDAQQYPTHPSVPERLLAFLDKFVPEANQEKAEKREMAWFGAIACINAHLMNHPDFKPKVVHGSFRDFIEYSKQFFPTHA